MTTCGVSFLRRLCKPAAAALALLFFLSLSCMPAEAKRMGGGSSVGMQRHMTPPSKPAQTLPATPPAAAPQAMPQRAPSAASPSPAPQPAAAAAQTGKRSWLGPLAGITAGLGLAWLFSQLGISETVGSLLFLLAGGVLLFWLACRILFARAPLATTPGAGGTAPSLAPFPPAGTASEAPDALRSAADLSPSPMASSLREKIDEAAFLAEAKRQFIALQEAHDRQEWATISRFMTPDLLATLQARSAHDWQPGQRTDVVQLQAELVDVAEEDDHYVVTVRFHGSIREESGATPQPFSEYWHLVKPVNGSSGWRLAGIEQSA